MPLFEHVVRRAASARAALALGLLVSPLASFPVAQTVTGGAQVDWDVRASPLSPADVDPSAVAAAAGRTFTATAIEHPSGPRLGVSAVGTGSGVLLWETDVALAPFTLTFGDCVADAAGELVVACAYEQVTGATRLLGLDAATGAVRFDVPFVEQGGTDTVVTRLALSPAGDVLYAAGWSGSQEAWLTAAFDTVAGNLLWEVLFDGDADPSDSEKVEALAVHPDGSQVFVTGLSDGVAGGTFDVVTIAYDASTGGRQWIARTTAGPTLSEFPHSIAVAPDGATVVVGWYAVGGGRATALAAGTGVTLWTSKVADDVSTFDTRVAFGATSDELFASGLYDVSGGDAVRLVRLGIVDGAVAWSADYPGPTGTPESLTAHALEAAPDGQRVFLGVNRDPFGSAPPSVATAAFRAADGGQEWALVDDGGGSTGLRGGELAVASDGSHVLRAARRPSLSGVLGATDEGLARALNAADGGVAWSATQTLDLDGDSVTAAVVAASDGGLSVVAARTEGEGVSFLDLVAFDGGGAELWTYREPTLNPQQAAPIALALAPDGSRAYAISDIEDFHRLVALDVATGAPLWSRDLPILGQTGPALDLQVSPGGDRVFAFTAYSPLRTVALDAVTGAVLWEEIESGLIGGVFGAVDPAGLRVYSASLRLTLAAENVIRTTARDAATGAHLWSFDVLTPANQLRGLAVAPDGSRIAVAAQGETFFPVATTYAQIGVANTATGAELWSRDLTLDGEQRASAVALNDSVLLVAAGSGEGQGVRAFDAATGAAVWSGADEPSFVVEALELEEDGTTVYAVGTLGEGDAARTSLRAFDAQAGYALWSGTGEALSLGLGAVSTAAGDRLLVAGRAGPEGTADLALQSYRVPSLAVVPDELSASAGGVQSMFLRADAERAGDGYLVAGSFSGVSPGFAFGGLAVPLNPDGYLAISVGPGSPLVGGVGALDPLAQGLAGFLLPAGTASIVGVTFHHAFGAVDPVSGAATFVSTPAALRIVP